MYINYYNYNNNTNSDFYREIYNYNIKDGLIAHYKFNNNLNNDISTNIPGFGIIDSLVNELDGTPTYTNDSINELSIVNNEELRLKIPNLTLEKLTNNGDFTISFWFKSSDNYPVSTNNCLFHSGNFGNGFSAWLYEGYLELFTEASDTFNSIKWEFSDVNFHKDWKLYTFSFSYQRKNENNVTYHVSLYVNKEIKETENNKTIEKFIFDHNDINPGFIIGNIDDTITFGIEGYYDDFRIYNKVFIHDGLIAHFNFNSNLDNNINTNVKISKILLPYPSEKTRNTYFMVNQAESTHEITVTNNSYDNGIYKVRYSSYDNATQHLPISIFNNDTDYSFINNTYYSHGFWDINNYNLLYGFYIGGQGVEIDIQKGDNTIKDTIHGDWIEITLPEEIILDSYAIYINQSYINGGWWTSAPKEIVVYAKNNDNDPWNFISTTEDMIRNLDGELSQKDQFNSIYSDIEFINQKKYKVFKNIIDNENGTQIGYKIYKFFFESIYGNGNSINASLFFDKLFLYKTYNDIEYNKDFIFNSSILLKNINLEIPNLNLDNDSSISFWFKIHSFNNEYSLFKIKNTNNDFFNFKLHQDSIKIFKNDTEEYEWLNINFTINKWILLNFIFTKNNITLYIDTIIHNNIYNNIININLNDLNIGDSLSESQLYYHDLRIYNKKISLIDIQNIYFNFFIEINRTDKYIAFKNKELNQTTYKIICSEDTNSDILIIGGGGAGASNIGSGGYAGNVIYLENQILNGTYEIKVGKGGNLFNNAYSSQFHNQIASGGNNGDNILNQPPNGDIGEQYNITGNNLYYALNGNGSDYENTIIPQYYNGSGGNAGSNVEGSSGIVIVNFDIEPKVLIHDTITPRYNNFNQYKFNLTTSNIIELEYFKDEFNNYFYNDNYGFNSSCNIKDIIFTSLNSDSNIILFNCNLDFTNQNYISNKVKIQVNIPALGYLINTNIEPEPFFIKYNENSIFYEKNLYLYKNLHIKNDIIALSTHSSPSDKKFKTNITILSDSTKIINELNPISFQWKNDTDFISPKYHNKDEVGFLAQEVEQILPIIVKDSFYKNISYKKINETKIIAYLINVIKNIDYRIKILEKNI